MSNLLGLDLGNGQRKAAIFDPQGTPVVLPNRWGESSTPSVVFLGEDGVIIGQEAINAAFQDPTRCVTQWKRSMGTDDVLATAPDGTPYRSKDIARVLLQDAMEDYAHRTGEVLSQVVLSVPANYNDRQKQDTIDAAEALKLDVLRLVHEPTAAALAHEVQQRGDGQYLIVDLGHGTLDVSVVEASGNNVDVRITSGEPHLGGQDFSARLEDFLLEKFIKEHDLTPTRDNDPLFFHELRGRAEQVKHSLSKRASTLAVVSYQGHITNVTVTEQDFTKLTKDLVDKALDHVAKALEDAQLTSQDVRELLAVGGASLMPMLSRALDARFGLKPSTHCEPHFAAALGCVIAGRMQLDQRGQSPMVNGTRLPPLNVFSRDVTSHSIGVAIMAEQDTLKCSVVLPKGVPMPSDQTSAFQLAKQGQTDALIQLLQGEAGIALDHCLQLGHFELTDMPPIDDGVHRIDVRLRIDRNGILTARAYDTVGGRNAELVLDYTKAQNAKDHA